jgi:hypothetical protein
MSVSGKTWHKISLVSPKLKLESVALAPEVGAQLAGSTIEFEFVQIDTTAQDAETLSLAKILIGLSK